MRKLLFVWIFVNSLAFADGFLSVHSPNGLDVWAVGVEGGVFHSVDGGGTWSSFTQGTKTLRSVFTYNSTVWMVGDSGACFLSTDGGDNWEQMFPAGTASLTRIFFADTQTGWIAGENGTLLKTLNGGGLWSSVPLSTTESVTSLAFGDLQNGYLGGTNGLLMKSTDGGTTWTSIAGAGWTKTITSVAVAGSILYVTGADGFCAKSDNAGNSWSELNFKTDSQSDVNGVFAKSSVEAVFVGGGGYVRLTSNGGASFSWGTHSFHAPLNSVFFFDDMNGWACSQKNNVVLRTTNGGVNWSLPVGTTRSMNWQQKLSVSAAIRGNAFCLNPLNKEVIYCALGTNVYASYNRGESWAIIATMPSGGSKVNSFYVSPKDTNLWVAAYGSPDRIVRSTNRGGEWTATITQDFSEYGMPLEMDGSHPDTLVFGPEDGHVYRSTDFGATWSDVSFPDFRSPCDIVIVRDHPEVIWVGDGVTGNGQGRMWLSRDEGLTFQSIYSTTGSEIPTIASSSLDPAVGYATHWGSGGVTKTVDMGQTWTSVATTGSTWGVDIAKDDPNVVMFGLYGGSASYLSSDAASSFVSSSLSGSNYAIYAYDRGTFFAQQSGGIWKLNLVYSVPTSNLQALTLTAPNGGENWAFGSTRNITWNSSNISNVKIEYKSSPTSSWQTITSSTPGGTGTYAWQIPDSPTTQARVRISDVADTNPLDSSNNVFSITVASIAAQPTSLEFGPVTIGSSSTKILSLTNGGTAPLVISSANSSDPHFIAGRTSFTIPVGQTDTLSVQFTPNAIQTFSEELSIACNAPGSPLVVPLSGSGSSNAAITLLSPNGGEVWESNSMHSITWSATALDRVEISYKTSPTSDWQRIAQNVAASDGTFDWLVPNSPTTQARVRIIDRNTGAIVDSSDNFFTIQSTTSVAETGIPKNYELRQNYPNPFNPSTVISYEIPKDAFVKLNVFNMIGQEIATLVNERQAAGRYTVTFDSQKLAGAASSGLYFYRLSAGDFVEIRKMMLLK